MFEVPKTFEEQVSMFARVFLHSKGELNNRTQGQDLDLLHAKIVALKAQHRQSPLSVAEENPDGLQAEPEEDCPF